MPHLPIFLAVAGTPCVVVGGGHVAARKVARLLACEARVTVVAPRLASAALAALAAGGSLAHVARDFAPADLDAATLAIAATDDDAVNAAVAQAARERRVPVNVVDRPQLCTFIMPSIVERHPVQIAISTGGASPVLARLLRARIESLVPAAYGRLAGLAARLRGRVQSRLPDGTARRRFWEAVLQGPAAEYLFAGREQAAEQAFEAALEREAGDPVLRGEVYLVGGGPGDPDLLTFRALRLMQQADVVVYDRLVAPAIVDLVRRDAERIYVGKAQDRHTLPQDEINALLVRLARQGRRVLRLKGGDPFIFGRGGEEIDTLAAQGIPFQVVPGITAAAGCASYAGIPLTHRDHAQSVLFVTGHLKDDRLDLNWEALLQPAQTVVVYMGVGALPHLARELLARGLPGDRPAAIVERGTTPRQRVLTGTLASLPDIAVAAAVQPPSLLIIGDVVTLHERLAWFAPAAEVQAGPGPVPGSDVRGTNRSDNELMQ